VPTETDERDPGVRLGQNWMDRKCVGARTAPADPVSSRPKRGARAHPVSGLSVSPSLNLCILQNKLQNKTCLAKQGSVWFLDSDSGEPHDGNRALREHARGEAAPAEGGIFTGDVVSVEVRTKSHVPPRCRARLSLRPPLTPACCGGAGLRGRGVVPDQRFPPVPVSLISSINKNFLNPSIHRHISKK
jgi:hypothetical protein